MDSRFLDKENFYVAFKKFKAFYRPTNEWYNPVELASYEANLTTNIERLTKSISKSEYFPNAIQPLPFPKKRDSSGRIRMRQYFRVSIDDQLVWIAMINVIGELLEKKMPIWNYGNRLFRPIWFEKDNDGKKSIQKGSYRNSNENFYRTWNQSWPLYRRHISMTVKIMGRNKAFEPGLFDEEKEKEIYDQEERNKFEYYYLNPNYWTTADHTHLYWAGLDFKSFYPSINADSVYSTIKGVLIDELTDEVREDCQKIAELGQRMLSFPIDKTGWRDLNHLTDEYLCNIKDVEIFRGVPTGLVTAGFLANVAMIETDKYIDSFIKEKCSLAVFKYVDDHVILSKSNEDLKLFLEYYYQILETSGTDVEFQWEKIQPKESFKFNSGKVEFKEIVDNRVDIEFPKPLMTQTIQKMSHLNSEEFDLADSETLENQASDLEHFLLTDFPEEEMRRDTRMSFAAMKLCQVAAKMKPDFTVLDEMLHNIKSDVTKESKHKPDQLELALANQVDFQDKKVKKKHERILKLLLKATSEHPDKIKLWKRSLELCFKTGINKVGTVFDELRKADLHPESKMYIEAFLILLAGEYLLEGERILSSESKTFWQASATIQFVNTCLAENLGLKCKEGAFPFLAETHHVFAFVRDFAVSRKYMPLNYGPIVPTSNEKRSLLKATDAFQSQTLLLKREDYLWYLLNHLRRPQKLALWKEQAMLLDLGVPTSWTILSLFPTQISPDLFERIQSERPQGEDSPWEHFDFIQDGTGILYDVFTSNNQIKDKHLTRFPILKSVINHEKHYVTLNYWLKGVIGQSQKDNWIDIRLSEWTLIEIIKQIVTLIQQQYHSRDVSIMDLYKIHPANYLVPTRWLTITKDQTSWRNWSLFVGEHPIKLTSAKHFVEDFRYLPVKNIWRGQWMWGNQFPLLVGLSVLMTKLLAKDLEWPTSSNKLAFIDAVFSQTTRTIEKQPISSDTRKLLSEIFSKRDNNFLSYEFAADAPVTTLNTFMSRLTLIQDKLSKHQVTLVNHSPRQLTIIDIDMLNETRSLI